MDSRLRHFDGHLIINFISDKIGKGLQERWYKKNPNQLCVVLKGQDLLQSLPNLNIPFPKDKHLKVTISVHGGIPGSRAFRLDGDSYENPSLEIESVANIIYELSKSWSLEVNLMVCSAGRGERKHPFTYPEKSLASKLHEAIWLKTGLDIPVVARKQVIVLETKTGRKYTIGVNSEIDDSIKDNKNLKLFRKQPYSKVVFSEEDGHQIQTDAYLIKQKVKQDKWKTEVIAVLDKMKLNTQVVSKVDFLKEIIQKLINLPPEKVFNELKAIKNLDVVKKHYWELVGVFKKSNTENAINKLIKKGERLFHSSYLEKSIVKKLPPNK